MLDSSLFWSPLDSVFILFISLAHPVPVGGVGCLLLICPLNGAFLAALVLFRVLLMVIFGVLLFDLKVIINFFAGKPGLLVLHVEVYLDIYVVAFGVAGLGGVVA